jgi:uncharacterized protein (DUF2336 family)
LLKLLKVKSIRHISMITAPGQATEHGALDTLNIDDILRLLPHTSEAVACLCAEKLVRGSLMNQRLADILLRRRDRSSLIVLSEGVGVSPFLLLHLAKAGSVDEARAIAACPYASVDILTHLVARQDPIIDRTIAECSGEPLPDAILESLTKRAFNDTRLAHIMFSRTDLKAAHRASLFAHASPRERISILNLANASVTTRPHAIDQDRLSALCAAIEAGDASTLTKLLADDIKVPFNVLYTILGEASGATLALTLKGMDVPASLIRRACRWAKSGHAGLPGGVEDVLESITPSAALWLVSAILSMAQTQQVDKPSVTVQTERLIA